MAPVIDRPDRRLSLFLRVRSYCGRVRLHGTVVGAIGTLVLERLRASRIDAAERRNKQPRITRVLAGADALIPASAVALYVHYAPVAEVSAMVLDQLETYRALGFKILFVSMAPPLPDAVLARVASRVALVVQRRNVGLDFGAWQDMLPFLAPSLQGLTELLLVNDSVVGPLRPLAPLIADMRASGPGLCGMTESLSPAPHLQSYFLLTRGAAAVRDVVEFLAAYKQTAYKRRVVRTGEIRLTGWMRSRGHAVSARFGYQPVENIALASPYAQRRLRLICPRLFAGLAEDDTAGFARRLHRHPLNPTHALWRELVESCGFPFVKTELLVRNPIGITDIDAWRSLLPTRRPELVAIIEAHLASMRQPIVMPAASPLP